MWFFQCSSAFCASPLVIHFFFGQVVFIYFSKGFSSRDLIGFSYLTCQTNSLKLILSSSSYCCWNLLIHFSLSQSSFLLLFVWLIWDVICFFGSCLLSFEADLSEITSKNFSSIHLTLIGDTSSPGFTLLTVRAYSHAYLIWDLI